MRSLAADIRDIDVGAVIDAAPVGSLQRRVVAICFLVAAADGFDTQAIGYVAPGIMRELALGAPAMGVVFAAGLTGLMVGAAMLGAAADRFGRKPVILCSCVTMGLCSFLTAASPDFGTLLLARFLTGLGLGGALPVINALTSEFAPARCRAMLTTLMFAGVPVGAVAAGLVAALLPEPAAWRTIFVVGGVLPIAIVPWVLLRLPESIRFLVGCPARHRELARTIGAIDSRHGQYPVANLVVREYAAPRGSFRELFADGRGSSTVLLWTLFLCNLFLVYTLVSWLPTIMAAAGSTSSRAVLSAVLFNAGGISLGLLLASVADRRGALRVAPWAFFGAAVSIAAVGAALSWSVGALAVIVLVGGFVGGTQFLIQLVAVEQYPTAIRAVGLGSSLAVGRLGAIAGPLVAGWLLALGPSASLIFLLASVPALLGAAAATALGHVARRQRARGARDV